MMPKIDLIKLRVSDPQAQKQFYMAVLGMTARADGTIGYGDDEARLHFEAAEIPYEGFDNDLYWKFSIAVPNIDLAYQQLKAKGVDIGEPRQVADVAYLAHLRDPEGFVVELVDHWFQEERPSDNADGNLLGGGPHLNLLTLRCHDIAQVEPAVVEMGMKLFYIAKLPERGFDLYFYGYSNQDPPNADPYAIVNRPWTYQRRNTVLEVQHRAQPEPMTSKNQEQAGYVGATIADLSQPFCDDHLLISGEQ